MTHLRDRKNRLSFVTNSTARYRGPGAGDRNGGVSGVCRSEAAGTRTRYEVSWRAIFDLAAEIRARRERECKGEERGEKR